MHIFPVLETISTDCETNCDTDVPVDSDMHCLKMAATLGFGWLLVLGLGTPPLHQHHSPHHIMC